MVLEECDRPSQSTNEAICMFHASRTSNTCFLSHHGSVIGHQSTNCFQMCF